MVTPNQPSSSTSTLQGDLGRATSAGGHSSEKEARSDGDLEKAELSKTEANGADNVEKARGAKGKGSRSWNPLSALKWAPPPPPPMDMDAAGELPLSRASFLSQLTFWWMNPILKLGYQRPLHESDLWKMDEWRQAGNMADRFEASWAKRSAAIKEWNESLESGRWKPGAARRLWWKVRTKVTGFGNANGHREMGLALCLSDTFFWEFWSAGLFKVVADLAMVSSPLITKKIIHFVQDSAQARDGVPGVKAPSFGTGVGYAVTVYILQIIYSVSTHQTFSRSGQTGVLARGALISAIYRRAMVLSGKSRVEITNSKLVSHISADLSRVDFAATFFHFSWTCVIQLLEVIIILLTNIGVSSLAGVALVMLAIPLQSLAMKQLYKFRRQSMVFTDQRIRMISEMLLGIRVMKLFAWEKPYLKKVHEARRKELNKIRTMLSIRAANQGLAMSIPMLASILVFLVYSYTGHAQDPAEIWTTISLLNLLRFPLMLLPQSLGTMTDAHNALKRLVPVFEADLRDDFIFVDQDLKDAVSVKGAEYTWEQGSKGEQGGDKDKKTKSKKSQPESLSDEKASSHDDDTPAGLYDIDFSVPTGGLTMVCGPVGSGKSSLLQGLIGEMRRVKGEVKFNGTIAYCAQTPWVQNATVRDNILFGQDFDEERYWHCVQACCLLPDLEMLPHGDQTEIGEKGITLSGGQRQRVSICRTLYYNAEIVLLDDPLSAVDAHVGQALVDNVIMGALGERTRILVTHAVQHLSRADQILYLEGGRIVEKGAYADLLAAGGAFADLCHEFGGSREEAEVKQTERNVAHEDDKEGEVKEKRSALMQTEERMVGSVKSNVHWQFLKAARAHITLPLVILGVLLMQGCQVVANFDLTWWQEDLWNRDNSFYLAIYGTLGLGTAIFTFLVGVFVTVMGTTASFNLHRGAINRVMRAPISIFDTTPIGRILNRFTKDIDSIDSRLNDSMRMSIATFAQIGGAAIIIAIVEPYFLIALAGVFVVYYFISKYYRASAREIKRLDNVLRSGMYAHFSESLAGLSTIRAFGESERFVKDNQDLIDLENRAYFLTVVNQRWLSVRIDFLGGILIFIIAMIAVGKRYFISASKIGLILAFIVAIVQYMSMVIRQTAEFENNLSSVERMNYYAEALEEEAPTTVEATEPPASWPAEGGITFTSAVMRYRPELPPVLKGLSCSIKPGEKVGVIGRTGAGKSSLMLTLFRIVELSEGSITVDGIDISKLGLDVLRSRVGIIPQEALLFAGTIRSNLDPFGVHDDVTLNSALKRAWLIDREGEEEGQGRFSLDTRIEDEGLNISVGERSLVSLARALVKDSRIIVLDECTASVDHLTDMRIQRTIHSEFKGKTLLTIAHRLRTIISYDRVMVMDAGNIAAFDTPVALFDKGSSGGDEKAAIFHGLCLQSGISRDEILAAAQQQL